MKKIIIVSLVMLTVLSFAFAQGNAETKSAAAPSKDDFHIGVVTGTVSQSEDDLRGAEALISEYGSVADGGMIQHLTYPDNFMDESETTISVIAGLADDPKMKAIIVNQGVPGTTEAFRQVKAKRPDIICIAGEAHEDPGTISSVADLTVNNDFVARGFLIINTAHQLGCDTFVHISFPRHMAYETMSRRVAIMRATCEELGMKFVLETAPDPTSDVGIAGAQQYILEKVPEWVEKYGKNTAYFCTNDAHTEPLLRQLLKYGGYFIEADLPSPLMGYPGALGIDLTAEAGDFAAILKKVEAAVVAQGGANRFGTWAFSYGYTTSAGLGQHAINVVKGESQLLKLSDLMKAYGKFTPGAKWNGSFYTDTATGVKAKNFVLIYQDTYIMGGEGFMGTTNLEVPEKYFLLK
ncbi:MAG: DUF3798 domain-containing protein [Sphaerochaetaceae bacterium]|nr:DUF3798 domain-containing protein [Sphaerochaetaceae bacterium]